MVWTAANRGRHNRRGQGYPSDMTNEEWTVIEPLLPVPSGKGRPRRHSLREVMNGIRYFLRYGIPWDAMPKDLPRRAFAMTIGACCPMADTCSGSTTSWS